MAPITASAEVGRPPEEVFAYVTDPTRLVEWQQGVVSGHMEGNGPRAVGDKCLTTRRIGGAERPVTSVITHIDPPRTWGVRAVDGPIRAIVDVTVAPLNEGHRSRVTINLETFRSSGPDTEQRPAMLRVAVQDYDIADVRPVFGKGAE